MPYLLLAAVLAVAAVACLVVAKVLYAGYGNIVSTWRTNIANVLYVSGVALDVCATWKLWNAYDPSVVPGYILITCISVGVAVSLFLLGEELGDRLKVRIQTKGRCRLIRS